MRAQTLSDYLLRNISVSRYLLINSKNVIYNGQRWHVNVIVMMMIQSSRVAP